MAAASSESPQALLARARELEARIESLRKRVSTGSTVTLVIGIALFIGLCVYFGLFYYWTKPLLEPKTFVMTATTQLEEYLPQVRQQLEKEIIKNSPTWAEDASEQAISSLPAAREYVEDAIKTQMDESVERLTDITAVEFRKFIQDNRPFLRDGFAQLDDPAKADKFLATLIPLLEEQLGGSLSEQADAMLVMIRDLNYKLAMAREGKDLDDELRTARRICMICRRLQLQQADPKLGEKPKGKLPAGSPAPTSKASTPAPEPKDEAKN